MSKKVEAIQRLRPNAEFVLRGDVLEWMDTTQTEPTQAEIDAEIAYLESPEYEVEKWRKSFKVDLYKLKIILDGMNDLDAVETIMAGHPKGVQLAWENANTVRRDSPTVAGLAQEMNYTPEQLDQIFKDAYDVTL